MHSFYVFEDSFFQGGGGWANVWVLNNLPQIKDAVLELLQTGWNLSPSGTLEIRVYQEGTLKDTHDVYPFIRLKLPGLTEISWDTDRRIHGGLPEPGGDYDWVAEELDEYGPEERDERMWVLLDETLLPEAEEHAVEITVDWAGMGLPEPTPPVLPEGTGIKLGERELEYDYNQVL